MRTLMRLVVRLGVQLLLVVIVAASLLHFSPLDPVTQYLNGNLFAVSATQKAVLAAQLGEQGSVWASVSQWLAHVAVGDWGQSVLYRQPVLTVLWERGQISLLLMSISWLLVLFVGYGLGLLAGLCANRWPDTVIRTTAWVLSAMPPFWLGMVLIAVFAVKLSWLPACCAAPYGDGVFEQGLGSLLRYMLLPMTTLVLVYMAPLILHTREKVVDVLSDAPVQYAQMHGQGVWARVRFHVVKNSLVPALVLHLASFAELFSGSMLAETLFNYPGLGQTVVKAGLTHDTALFLGATVLSAVLVFVGNALASLCADWLTPGVRR